MAAPSSRARFLAACCEVLQFCEAARNTKDSDRIRAIADYYEKSAKKIVEPGSCCTSVEVTVDNYMDTRSVKGFHQLFILGDLVQEFRNYAQLASMEVEGIC